MTEIGVDVEDAGEEDDEGSEAADASFCICKYYTSHISIAILVRYSICSYIHLYRQDVGTQVIDT